LLVLIFVFFALSKDSSGGASRSQGRYTFRFFKHAGFAFQSSRAKLSEILTDETAAP